jgi:hypothetical protein
LSIPDDPTWLALVAGALSELGHEYNYEPFGSSSPEDTAQRFRDMLAEFEDCEPTVSDLIIVAEQYPTGYSGGTFVSGAWRQRTLNAEIVDTANIASLSGGNLTIPAGTYRYEAQGVACAVGQHRVRLQNITAGTTIAIGENTFSQAYTSAWGVSAYDCVPAFVTGQFTIEATTTISLEHFGAVTVYSYGFGILTNLGVEQYATLKLERIA